MASKLSEVLWALRTTAIESSFFMTFGTKTVIQVEMAVPSDRVNKFNPETNGEGLKLNLDLCNINKKQKITKHYNARVSTALWH